MGLRLRNAFCHITTDALYGGSLLLLVNTALLSIFGFLFWTLAAHNYSAATIGLYSGITSGVNLLAAVAALGLPNMVTRHLATIANARDFVMMTMAAIAVVGGVLCLAVVLILGPHLPTTMHLQEHGSMVPLVTVLVVITAASSAIDAGLVVVRAIQALLISNLAGSVVKILALYLLQGLHSSGLLAAYGLGLIVATGLGGLALIRRVKANHQRGRALGVLRAHLSATGVNYLATVIGILPITVVPLEVLAIRGAVDTGRFAIAFLIAGFLNFIPSTTAQVLFAEASRRGVPMGQQLRKAVIAVYALLLPSLAVLLGAAPLLLRMFGKTYAAEATVCLRVLALSTLLTGGTYLIDALLIARDRSSAYLFMNGINAALVLGCTGALLHRGLTAAAWGWAAGQGISLLLGLAVVACGPAGRHRRVPDQELVEAVSGPASVGELVTYAVSVQPKMADQEFVDLAPTAPFGIVREGIGWGQPIAVGSELFTKGEIGHPILDRRIRTYTPGEIAFCGLWFPPTQIPVGPHQIRSAAQLPVLTMVTAYSGWLCATLLPSIAPEDLLMGWWQLFTDLDGIPHTLTLQREVTFRQRPANQVQLLAECRAFCRALGADIAVDKPNGPEGSGLLDEARKNLESSFLQRRTFPSPAAFNVQLQAWLASANTAPRHARLAPADLVATDWDAMLPIPSVSPPVGWRRTLRLGNEPFVRFESNRYSVHPAAAGLDVELLADLTHVRVFCKEVLVADHERAWTSGRMIFDPAHTTAV